MPNNFETGASDNQDSNADNPWVRSMEEFGSDGQKVDVEDGLKKHQLQEFGSDGQMVDVYDNVVPTETHQLQEFGSDGQMVDIVEPKKPLPDKEGNTILGVDEGNGLEMPQLQEFGSDDENNGETSL